VTDFGRRYMLLATYDSKEDGVVDIARGLLTGSGIKIVFGDVYSVLLEDASDVALDGDYAYMTAYGADRVVIIDISNPAAPSVVGSVTHADLDGARGIALSGDYAYVTGYNADTLVVVDISNPTAPSVVGSVTHADLNGARGIALSGDYAYVGAYDADKVVVVDIIGTAHVRNTHKPQELQGRLMLE